MTVLDNAKGVSLIAAIFIIVVLAFMGLMFLTMTGTSTLTSVNDLQSTQAFSIAEGGVEYAQYSLAQDLDWYRSPAPASTTLNLGTGSFTVSTNLPATMLSKKLHSGELNTINVYTTDRFPSAGLLQIDDDASTITGSGEFVQYTNKTATTFTGLTRAVQFVGNTLGNTPAADFDRGTMVYPVATLLTPNPLPGNCNPVIITLSVDVTNNKFLSAGSINVYDRTTLDHEEITYAGSSTSGGVMTLTGVQRCRNTPLPATVNAGDPVTPINVDSPPASPDFEAEIVSTGSVGSAVRVVRKTVQR